MGFYPTSEPLSTDATTLVLIDIYMLRKLLGVVINIMTILWMGGISFTCCCIIFSNIITDRSKNKYAAKSNSFLIADKYHVQQLQMNLGN